MKIRCSALGIVITSTLVLSGVGPVAALEPESSSEAMQAALDGQIDSPAQVQHNELARELDLTDGIVTAPSGVGAEVELRFPGEVSSTRQEDDLVLDVTGGSGYTTALHETGSGTFRALVQIDSPSAPKEYAFEMGEGVSLQPLEDGGVTVWDADGTMLGLLEPAWATDATGASIATSYEIRGTAVVQYVDFGQSTAFPVVADPFWIPALLIMARLSAHVAQRAAAKGISQALIKQVVQNGKKIKGNGNTSIFTTGRGTNQIRVVVNNRTGTIITVTKG